jgi:hypothetical protein
MDPPPQDPSTGLVPSWDASAAARAASAGDEDVDRKILLVRGERVLLDSDLAELYGVETKALVQAVKRNAARFPPDFMSQVTGDELGILRSQTTVTLPRRSPVAPVRPDFETRPSMNWRRPLATPQPPGLLRAVPVPVPLPSARATLGPRLRVARARRSRQLPHSPD